MVGGRFEKSEAGENVIDSKRILQLLFNKLRSGCLAWYQKLKAAPNRIVTALPKACHTVLHSVRHLELTLFRRRIEIIISFVIIIILCVSLVPQYQTGKKRSQLTDSYLGLKTLVDALRLYSTDRPDNRAFPPDVEWLIPGIVLCPLHEPDPDRLYFLTNPTAYLRAIPNDPFITEVMKKENRTPIILHWVKSDYQSTRYTHTAWGALSVGPSLAVPPDYDLSVLRRTPYETRPLRFNLFDPSNGTQSAGFLYFDSFGNATPI